MSDNPSTASAQLAALSWRVRVAPSSSTTVTVRASRARTRLLNLDHERTLASASETNRMRDERRRTCAAKSSAELQPAGARKLEANRFRDG